MFRKNKHMSLFSKLSLDHNRLTKQPIFWIATILPILVAIILGSLIVFNEWHSLHFNFTSIGYDNFLKKFKLPLWVSSISIPLSVIVVNIHRTIQTEKQIIEMQEKNSYDYIFSHQKHYVELLSKIGKKSIKIEKTNKNDRNRTKEELLFFIDNPSKLYHSIFLDGIIKDNEQRKILINNFFNEIKKSIDEIKIKTQLVKTSEMESLISTKDLINFTKETMKKLHINDNCLKEIKIKSKKMILHEEKISIFITDITYLGVTKVQLHTIIYFIERISDIFNVDTPTREIIKKAREILEHHTYSYLNHYAKPYYEKMDEQLKIETYDKNEKMEEYEKYLRERDLNLLEIDIIQ